jgi:hypothetical protein
MENKRQSVLGFLGVLALALLAIAAPLPASAAASGHTLIVSR